VRGQIRSLIIKFVRFLSILSQTFLWLRRRLAACVNYADLNNSVVRMRDHVSAGFFRCDVLFLQGKHNGFRHIVASAQSEFFNIRQILMLLLNQNLYLCKKFTFRTCNLWLATWRKPTCLPCKSRTSQRKKLTETWPRMRSIELFNFA